MLNLKYKFLVLTMLAFFVWAIAADMPFTFKAGDVISAEQMNQNFAALNTAKQERVTGSCAAGSSISAIDASGKVTCEVDDIGNGSNSGVDAINGQTGAVTLQAGDNITIDDSTVGQIKISASAGGTNSNAHDHFGQTWTGISPKAGFSIINTVADNDGPIAMYGRIGSESTSLGLNSIGIWGEVPSGAGVAGSSPSGFGVYGVSMSNRGVYGQSESSSGVYGESTSDVGVDGIGNEGIGVRGLSITGDGVLGRTTTGTGVSGISAEGTGVTGVSGGTGIQGITSGSGSSGVRGEVNGAAVAYGVSGFSTNGPGVYGESTNNAGVFGKSKNNNAAFFTGGSGGSGNCFYNGGAGWNCTSDRNAKENFKAINSKAILEQLASMPISTWNMKGDTALTPHLGPVAQDFYSTFGLGDSDITINTADAQGVALAAIQGLYQLVQEQQAQIKALESQLSALK